MEKFFNKILLTYTLILIIALTALAVIVFQNLTVSASNEAVNFNTKAVQDVKSFLDQKIDKVKLILKQLYLNQTPSSLADFSDIFDLLNNKAPDKSNYDYVLKIKTMDKYLQYGCLFDNDIVDIMLLNISDLSYYFYTRRSNISYQTINPDTKSIINSVAGNHEGTLTIPSINIFEANDKVNPKKDIFSTAIYIRSLDFSKNLGILLVNFNSNSLLKAYTSKDEKFNSTVIVFTKEGDVVFDSSGEYYNTKYPYFNEIRNSSLDKVTKLLRHNKIINISTSKDGGYIIAGIMPNEQILKSTRNTRGLIIFLLLLCITTAVFLSFMVISFISRRIKAINTTMGIVKSGDLSARVKISKNMDEINQIAVNFNQMCDNLNIYISQVYLSELKQKDAKLKQKSAELYALQSQVNPHFLYNTLEAIRMRALTYGNDEVAQMILLLAALFRDSIKKEVVVKIKDELKYCKSYLELYNIRYGMNLEVVFDIDNSILEFSIVKLLLQPLIENAVVHGIEVNKQGNLIIVKAYKAADNIEISIQDNGSGIDNKDLEVINKRLESINLNECEGVGIINVSQRIKLIYGEQYGLTIYSKKLEGTTILVKMPAKSIKEMETIVQRFNS